MKSDSDHEANREGLFRKFKRILDVSDDEYKSVRINTHEAIDLIKKKIEDGFSSEETRLSTLLDTFYCGLGSKPDNGINYKINQLALRLSEIDCRSCSVNNIKNRITASQENKNNLEASVASLEKSCTSFQAIVKEVDEMKRDLVSFSSDWRLSQMNVLLDMRSMQRIKNNYSDLSKSLSESDRQISELLSSVEKAPDQRLLILWKKEIDELEKRKTILSNHVDQYMGIDTDTSVAKSQLNDALSQMASVDSQLQRVMGFNAWN
ncbi:hypothetical protein KSF78_0007229 [Schistosoma japonicum]|nr:hypothetical protein KSF78_0007229 [Schistosoma japonicum]KAH8860505.1 hypothetical protein KSF78_0007229 [Schistosoma japonicum]